TVTRLRDGHSNVESLVDAFFLQIFIWERFKSLSSSQKIYEQGKPRALSWVHSCHPSSGRLLGVMDEISNFNFCLYLMKNV
ncbi:hypothetical protein TorRG33x02_329950, partial [Trema orientale]